MTLSRRDFVALAAASVALVPGRAPAGPGPTRSSLRAAAREAWLYGLPYIEIARVRASAFDRGHAPNTFRHRRDLNTPASRTVTTPNNDTLSSSAFIGLRRGPVTVTIPAAGARYFSLAFMDMASNNFAILGTRTIGGSGGTFVLAGPRQATPVGALCAPTPGVWALFRTLVEGPADLEAARRLQDGLRIEGAQLTDAPMVRPASRSAAWPQYFTSLAALLGENPPPATDTAFFHRTARLKLTPEGAFDPTQFSATEGAEIAAGVAEAQAFARAAESGPAVNGWDYPLAHLGDYGQDYAYRGAAALSGLAALPREEAMYMRALTPDGSFLFDGEQRWRLRLPAERALPMDGFWSLTLYEATADGQYFLTENPIHRYSIGDRSPGLFRSSDGSLDIWISRDRPESGRVANWLPAPARGPYALTLRVYLPRPALLSGRYLLPPLEAIPR